MKMKYFVHDFDLSRIPHNLVQAQQRIGAGLLGCHKVFSAFCTAGSA
jgi:hypothetical protein